VNPNYKLVDLRPEGFEPNVSALDFTEDGDLVVATAGNVSAGGWVEDPYTGEIYIVESAQDAEGPEDVTVRRVADGLFNPMGIAVIGDSIFVSERDGLTELIPDPETAEYIRNPEHGEDGKFATWPDGGNFHEFAFGLVYDEENFYLSLSVAINPGGSSTDPQPAPNRGTTSRWTGRPGRSSSSPVACAPRTASAGAAPRATTSSSWTTRATGCPAPSWSTSSPAASSTTTPTRPGPSTTGR